MRNCSCHKYFNYYFFNKKLEFTNQGKRSTDPEYVSNQALRLMCDNVLQLLATTVEDMEPVSREMVSK